MRFLHRGNVTFRDESDTFFDEADFRTAAFRHALGRQADIVLDATEEAVTMRFPNQPEQKYCVYRHREHSLRRLDPAARSTAP